MIVKTVMEVMIGGGYIRNSDLDGLETLLASEGISFNDAIASGEVAAKLTKLQSEYTAISAELARLKATPTIEMDRPVADTKDSGHTLSLWHPPGKPEDLRVYVNARGLRKVHLIKDTDDAVLVRGRFGRPATREEVHRVAGILSSLGLRECTWTDILGYIAALPVSGEQASAEHDALKAEQEALAMEAEQQ